MAYSTHSGNIQLTDQLLGKGAYGKVHVGQYKVEKVAVKIIPLDFVNNCDNEIELRKNFDHPNVLKLLTVEEDEHNGSRHWYLVLELCAGTLQDVCLYKYKGPALPPDAIVLYQIACGLNYIHSMKLVHSDIKPTNILISVDPVVIKIADSGHTKPTNKNRSFTYSAGTGTICWVPAECFTKAPQDLQKKENGKRRDSKKRDIFSTGLVFFYYLTKGKHLFGKEHREIEKNIEENNPVNLKLLEKDRFSYISLIEGMTTSVDKRFGNMNKVLELLTLATRFRETRVSPPQMLSYCLSRFHPTDAVFACGLSHGQVTIFKGANRSMPFSNWEIERELKVQNVQKVESLEWNVNGTQLAAACYEGPIIAWSYPSGEILFQMNKYEPAYGMKWNPFRQDVFATLIGPSWREKLWLCSTRANGDATMKTNNFHTLERDEHMWRVKWISANRIALGLWNGLIEIWEIDEEGETTNSRIIKQFKHGDHSITNLKWNETTEYLASCSLVDRWIKIWSMDSDEPVHSLEADSRCWCLAWRPNGKRDDVDGGISAARKSKNNLTIACGFFDGRIVIWNPLEKDETKQKRILPEKHSGLVWSLSFSPDGRFLASEKSEISIWSTETWTTLFTSFGLHGDRVSPHWYPRLSWMPLGSLSDPTAYKLTAYSNSGGVTIIESIDWTQSDESTDFLNLEDDYKMNRN